MCIRDRGKRHAPCIIFIDEIDAVARQRGTCLLYTSGYNHLGMFGISLIVLILILTLMAQSRDLKESLAGYETRAEALSQQIEEEQARTQEIEDLKQYMLCLLYTSRCV